MEIEVVIKNYRCFPETHPAKITLKKGFTALVGINNAGKSSLLKFFYEFRHLFQSAQNSSVISESVRGAKSISYPSEVFDVQELFSNTNEKDISIEISTMVSPTVSGVTTKATLIFTIMRGTPNFTSQLKINNQIIPADNMDFGNSGFKTTGESGYDLHPLLTACSVLGNTVYIGAFRNAINIGTKNNYFDIQIGEAFITQWRSLKEGRNKKQNEAAIKITNDIKQIFDYESLEINPSDDNQSLTIYANQKSYKLHELGAGISQFIMVLVSASLKNPSFILIDEPEINLHPSLQLDFLTTLASYANDGIVYSTHSIGLARASADEILSVKRLEEGVSQVSLYEDTAELPVFIGELSYSNYSQLGFEKILLVEGVTEVKCIQQFLREYRKDHKIVLVPLGGAQLIKSKSLDELMEITRITKDVHALIDSEKSSETEALSKEREGFKNNCEKAGINCHVLEKRAIENYLTEKAIQKAMKSDKYHSLQPFQKREEIAPVWSKNDNWRIAREMDENDIKDTDLGKFLSEL